MTRLTDTVQDYAPAMGIPYNNAYMIPYIQTGSLSNNWVNSGIQVPTFSDGIGPMYPQSSQQFDFRSSYYHDIQQTNNSSDVRTFIETQEYSIGMWLLINDQNASSNSQIFSTGGTGGHISFGWSRGSSNDYSFYITGGGTTTITTDQNGAAIVPGKWYYLAARLTNDGTTVTFDKYINAYKKATTTTAYDNSPNITKIEFGVSGYQEGSINIGSFYLATSASINEAAISAIFASAQPISHVVKYWDGSAWQIASDIKFYYDGAWRPIWANYWTGSAWAIL